MSLTRITFAGIDEGCTPEQLLALARSEPRLEYAILYQPPKVKPRYPSLAWIVQIGAQLYNAGIPLALHVCGESVSELLAVSGLETLPGRVVFERIQLNAKISAQEEEALRTLINRLAPIKVITQEPVNPGLHLRTCLPTHQVVFDGSLGRGLLAETYPNPFERCECGYSGGLGPKTISQALPLIFKAAGSSDFWIDMESGLRDERNVFSFDNARATLARIAEVEQKLRDESAS